MKRAEQIAIVGVGIALLGAATGEHLYRRVVERQYRQAVENRRRLERQIGEALANHERVVGELKTERDRAQQLAGEVLSLRGRLEETVGRLAEENNAVRGLQLRLAQAQQQMGQLQGELVVTLQDQAASGAGKAASPIQLQRVVVSDVRASEQLAGRVLSVHRDWNFVVINFGWETVRIGDTVAIFRDGELLARAKVERVQEGVSAATIMPEWNAASIRINDVVRTL